MLCLLQLFLSYLYSMSPLSLLRPEWSRGRVGTSRGGRRHLRAGAVRPTHAGPFRGTPRVRLEEPRQPAAAAARGRPPLRPNLRTNGAVVDLPLPRRPSL